MRQFALRLRVGNAVIEAAVCSNSYGDGTKKLREDFVKRNICKNSLWRPVIGKWGSGMRPYTVFGVRVRETEG